MKTFTQFIQSFPDLDLAKSFINELKLSVWLDHLGTNAKVEGPITSDDSYYFDVYADEHKTRIKWDVQNQKWVTLFSLVP